MAGLRNYLRIEFSPRKTPGRWFCVDTFPLTGSDKIQKFALRARWEAGDYNERELTT